MKRIAFFYLVALMATAVQAAPLPRFFVETKGHYLFGAWINGKWVDGVSAQKMVRGGENYVIFNELKSLGLFKGGKASSFGGECANTYLVKLQTPVYKPGGLLARRMGPPRYIAVSGVPSLQSKKLMPRSAQTLDSAPIYHNFVVQWLKTRGVKQPQVAISKIWRTDLDGDGKPEVIINAMRHNYITGSPRDLSSDAHSGDYSLLLVQRMKGKKRETIAIESQIYPQAKAMTSPTLQELTNVLDLNGDGKMEIIVHGRYYEGDWMSVYEWQGTSFKRVLTTGCGV